MPPPPPVSDSRSHLQTEPHSHPMASASAPTDKEAAAAAAAAVTDEDESATSLGGHSPCTPTGTTPPPPPPLYHHHQGDHPFAQKPSFAGLLCRDRGGAEIQQMAAQEVDGGGRRRAAAAGEGVHLTWEDLWVTVPDGKGGSRAILGGSTGYAEPGKVLAIMGPSGCGKTTLLDTLAGRLASNTRQSGDVLINGRRQTLAFGTSAYVTQDDILMTTLTVREAVYFSAQLQLPDSMSGAEKRARAEATIREMGLQEAADTRIGKDTSRGLSNGQKRRVSICLEMLMRPWLLFMDEPTSGLDSAASFHVMKRIASLARRGGRTIVVSIHQPSSEVFGLFDQLCLLTYGKTVYFGPRFAAAEFFAKNGIPCPPQKNPADHFLRAINSDFEQEMEDGVYSCQEMEGGGGPDDLPMSTTEAIKVLISAYKTSEHKQRAIQRVAELSKAEGAKLKNGSQAGLMRQCVVLTHRSLINMYRDVGYYWLRFTIYVGIAICLGTEFYKLDYSYPSISDRGSVLMFIAGFLTFMTIGGFPSFVEDMKIFGRERLNGHYGVGAYVISHTFSSAPFLLFVSVVPGVIAYYMVGLQRSLDHFVYFALVLYSCMILVESLMMMVASIVPDFLMGIITGAGIQGLMMLTGGFFRLPDDIPKPVWKYPMYHMSFHKYADQAFYKNEFLGLTFPNKAGDFPPVVTGMQIIKYNFEMEVGYSKWVDLGILFGMVVVYRVLFFTIIKIKEIVTPIIRNIRRASPRQAVQSMELPTSTPPPPMAGKEQELSWSWGRNVKW